MKKICHKCNKEKELSEFFKDNRYKDGLHSWCKDCRREYNKEYRKTDKHKEYQKKYEKTDKCKRYRKKYQKTDKHKEYIKKYHKTDKYKEYRKKWKKKERDTNHKYKLDSNISTSIYIALKGKKAGRRWETLTGYTIEDLMAHLESKFEPWMNWDNYGNKAGKWTIDHIKPRSLFNYESPEDTEFKECWSLENLQPMEFIENIKKSNKHKE